MYPEEDWIQLSSVQHYVYCPRQCGLIHVEGLWTENRFTARGRIMHERVDSDEDTTRGNVRTVRSLNVFSRKYGLSGRADVVEFISEQGAVIPYPVEYKSGKPKPDDCDMVQLCAQAFCLEEMLKIVVPHAALFYGKTRHRVSVELTRELRERTENIITEVHRMISNRLVPDAKYSAKCRNCSMNELCQPKLGKNRVQKYISGIYNNHEATQ